MPNIHAVVFSHQPWEEPMPLYAHYFECEAGKVLAITEQPVLAGEFGADIRDIDVASEAEARRIAAERNITPLNF